MSSPFLRLTVLTLGFLLTFGCADDESCALNDANCDGVPDDLGRAALGTRVRPWDFNNDGVIDGYAVDRTGDGQPDALGLDTNGDGFVDAVDLDFDGVPDEYTPNGTFGQATTPGAPGTPGTGGGAAGTGGAPAGSGGVVVGTGGIVVDPVETCLDANAAHGGGMNTTEQYGETDVTRNGQGYRIIYNGWGGGFGSQNLTASGTRLRVESFSGSEGVNGEPAGYPTVYIGNYSNTGSSPGSPFPIAVNDADIVTGLKWSGPASGDYNVAWDIWLSNGGGRTAFFMVWVRDPPAHFPAGLKREEGFTMPGIDGVWNIHAGTVNILGEELPIINYVRPEGQDSTELSFNVRHFFDDAIAKGYNLNGSQIMSVAVGFEIWNGPVSNLGIDDFCVRID